MIVRMLTLIFLKLGEDGEKGEKAQCCENTGIKGNHRLAFNIQVTIEF